MGYYYDSLVSANYTLLTPPSSGSADNSKSSAKTTVVESESGDSQSVDNSKPLFELNGAVLEPGTLIIGNGIARLRNIARAITCRFVLLMAMC